MRILCFLSCLIALAAGALAEIREGDVVAFVGGTDMVRMQQRGMVEATLTLRYSEAGLKFRDLAWDGDTVYFQSTVGERWRREAFGDWDAQLERVGATVVVAQFGKIESLDGLGRLDRFKAAYRGLIDTFAGGGRRVILVRPEPVDWKHADASAYRSYMEAIEQLAAERQLELVDLEGFGGGTPSEQVVAAVREKHRLWSAYWRPANWKCLFGDDAKRVFGNAAEGLPSFKDEWSTYPALIAAAEEAIARGEAIAPRVAPQRTGSPEADIGAELAAFEVLEGYEVKLFADESHGIANPLSVRWDPDGRMFVACTDVYPQIEPGVVPDDKVIALRDADGDGVADQSEVFARGLNIPTGMEVGAEGVYIGQNTELLLLRWDGSRRRLLSGFGNGDSHQTINSFVWGPSADLWFCQGDGIESRVETPFGIASLFQAGVFRLRPGTLQLDGLLDDFMGPGNPWGVAFDDFGQSFVVDGAGGISYLTPAAIPAKRRLKLPRIGDPGGYCGVECLGDGEFLVGDYKKNQVSRFRVEGDGAGFEVEFQAPLLRSRHRNFRPIDVKLGPDGAVYVVDWYNPITCHQDDFYRHPDRDKTHGRIWRVAKRGASAGPAAALTEVGSAELIELLRSPQRWQRLKAKQVLATRGIESLPAQLRDWTGRDLFEALALAESLGIADVDLLERGLDARDHRVRAYAARVAGRWGEHQLLREAAADEHPRVRMEVLLACAQIPEARSVLIAAAVAEQPRDRWIDYALEQAVYHLAPLWKPAFERGELDFGDRPRGMAAVLEQADSGALLDAARAMLGREGLEAPARIGLAKSLVALGDESDLRRALRIDPPSAEVLLALAGRGRPGFEIEAELRALLAADRPEIRAAAVQLVGQWRVALHAEISGLAGDPDAAVRERALQALGLLGGDDAMGVLRAVAADEEDLLQPAAIASFARLDAPAAASLAARELWQDPSLGGAREGEVWRAFALREGGGQALAGALGEFEFDRSQGEQLYRSWLDTGLVDDALSAVLGALAGLEPAALGFDETLLLELVAAGKLGERQRGAAVFGSDRAGCAACHRVGSKGGSIGPDLSAVGSGVSPERIVTELMWPQRQVKEGFSLSRITRRDGSVLQGYEQHSRDKAVLLLKDLASGEFHRLERDAIAKSEALGSLMPPTAQSLSREELADLCAYLFSLSGEE